MAGAGVLMCAAVLGGCAGAGQAETPALAGSSWELVSIESMDDTQGVTEIPDPAKFTVAFGADGRAAFRLDCNQGGGSWEADPAEGESGALTFGPIASTLMACPPPSLDGRVSTELSNVTGYLFADDQLHLSTKYDGSILHWRAAPA
ncbi:META domain-containing protein [Mycolicibacterium brumae]|uniref:META domain-containing protein n=1 Tax=Mycolicibacterium brumae TaxID=85968 RepID=UPI001F21AE34|nr:META domain-containing protein [Mycolicibacterium brumae]UWW08471.1 META domain-containing protein [Mycolicibacterium brumae]